MSSQRSVARRAVRQAGTGRPRSPWRRVAGVCLLGLACAVPLGCAAPRAPADAPGDGAVPDDDGVDAQSDPRRSRPATQLSDKNGDDAAAPEHGVMGLMGDGSGWDAPSGAPVSAPADAVRRTTAEAGTSEWDLEIAAIFRDHFDADGSGQLDSAAEVRSVPCDVWRAMDDEMSREYGNRLMCIYGFVEPYIWVGYAFGIDERLRGVAADSQSRCGLAP